MTELERLSVIEAIITRVDQIMSEIDKLATDLQKHRRELFFSINDLKARRE